ncbi:hypothetical protein WJX72_009224 [[Myrmecia] bisecta]|uniref:EamA domain-containing protein n=1 Tax=[Myrmecia] bisecta TaxID=41462 RepID=A0AAW1R882_9CHLO
MSSTPVAAAPAEGGASEAEEAHLLPRPQPQPEPASLGPPAASDAANIGAEAVAKPAAHVPCFAWAILGASVTAVSSAAAVFQSMQEVPPLVLTAWRLSLTSCIIFPAAAVSFHKLPPEDQRRAVRNLHILLAGSLLLAVHFACFVWGLMHTSLTHCLLYASSTPLIIAGATWVLRRPISAGELLGTGLGMLGAVLLASGATADRQVTFAGDMASLASAACFVVYLSIGQHLRSWMPLFVFAWPVGTSDLTQ